MTRLFCLLVILIQAGFVTASVKGFGFDDADEVELRQIEELRRQAIKTGDEKTLNAIYADDFRAIAGNGAVIDKSELMAVFKRNDPAITFTTDEISIRVFDNTAVFVGRLVGRNSKLQVVSGSRFTHFFVRRNGKWKCVAGQSTPLPMMEAR